MPGIKRETNRNIAVKINIQLTISENQSITDKVDFGQVFSADMSSSEPMGNESTR